MSKAKKSILVITYHYSPSASVGGKRFSFLSHLFHNKDFLIHILTIKEKYHSKKDTSYPFSGFIHRTAMFPKYPVFNNHKIIRKLATAWVRYLCIFDPYSGWIFPALFKGLKILKREKIDLIIVSGPPFSAVISALILKIIGRVKLIIDYRDPWTTHPFNIKQRYGNVFFKKLNWLAEKIAVKHANALVFNTKMMKDDAYQLLKSRSRARFYTVYNGISFADEIEPLLLDKNKKVILYTGEFYGERKISLLSKPVVNLLRKGKIKKEKICINVLGKLKDEDWKVLNHYQIADIVREQKKVKYHKMLRLLKGAHLLLLISGTNVKYAIPYKFYDYLGAEKPILALSAEDSAVNEIMKSVDCGIFVNIENSSKIEDALNELLNQEKKYTFAGKNKYTWHVSANNYRNIINQICEEKS
jgi:glycosyltransferase involved in cell wall biosynthesis